MLTRQCGRKAFPGSGGFFARRLGPPWLSPPPTGFAGWNLVPTQVGPTIRTEQVRLMVRTVPQHRQSSWGKGVVQVAQDIYGWSGKTPPVCCNIKRFKALRMFSFAQGSTWESIPVKRYIHRIAVHPRRLNRGGAGKRWSSRHVILEAEAAKEPCCGGLFSSSLKLQHHGRW